MSSSTSSSEAPDGTGERARALRFLGLAALLVLGAEAGLALLADESRGRHEVDDCAHAVAAFGTPPRTVLLSDSVSYGVLDAVDLPPDVLDLSNNQTIAAAGNAFLLRRLWGELDRRGADGPEAVVIVMNPVSWEADLGSERFLQPYFVTVFRRPEEIADVAATLGRPELVAAMRRAAFATALHPPSTLRRGLVHTPLRDALRALKRAAQERLGGGANEAPGGAGLWAEAARAKIEERSALTRFGVSPVSAAYLPRIAALCAERGARLYLVPAPLPPTVLAAWRANGYWPSYLETLERLAGVHGAAIVPECPYLAPDDASFYDGVHLVQSAKDAWAEVLAGVLRRPQLLLE